MKEINIVWDKVTAHSRFWALVIFIVVLPALAFYTGILTEKLNNEQESLAIMSQQTIFKSEHGMCKVSDCTMQPLTGTDQNTTSQRPSGVVDIVSPKKGDHINPKTPLKVIWNAQASSTVSRLSVLLIDDTGQAVSKPVLVPTSLGSTTIDLPKKISKTAYSVLIQPVDINGSTNNTPFVYSGDFYL